MYAIRSYYESFFDSAEAGLKALQDAGRITYKTIEMGGTDEDQPKWLETLYEVAEAGEYDLIICGTYQMPDYLKEVATAYPDQKFLIYDDTSRITSYNVCYTKLLRIRAFGWSTDQLENAKAWMGNPHYAAVQFALHAAHNYGENPDRIIDA